MDGSVEYLKSIHRGFQADRLFDATVITLLPAATGVPDHQCQNTIKPNADRRQNPLIAISSRSTGSHSLMLVVVVNAWVAG